MNQSVSETAMTFRKAVRLSIQRHRFLFLAQGVLLVVAGIVAIGYPIVSSLAVISLLGWLLIVGGIIQGISLIGATHAPHFWLQVMSVSLGIVVGLLLLSHPGEGLLALTLLLIVYLIMEGVSRTVFALTVRPLPKWGLVLLSGILSIVLAVYIWSSLPLSAAWILGLTIGASLIAQGGAIAWFAWGTKQEAD